MKRFAFGALAAVLLDAFTTTTQAAPCLIVTLTGTQGGPSVFNGQAGPERWCGLVMTAMIAAL